MGGASQSCQQLVWSAAQAVVNFHWGLLLPAPKWQSCSFSHTLPFQTRHNFSSWQVLPQPSASAALALHWGALTFLKLWTTSSLPHGWRHLKGEVADLQLSCHFTIAAQIALNYKECALWSHIWQFLTNHTRVIRQCCMAWLAIWLDSFQNMFNTVQAEHGAGGFYKCTASLSSMTELGGKHEKNWKLKYVLKVSNESSAISSRMSDKTLHCQTFIAKSFLIKM